MRTTLFLNLQEGEGAPLRFKTFTSKGSNNGTCFPEKTGVPLEMHSCQFKFMPGEAIEPGLSHGTIKLEPGGCGPLTTKTFGSCSVSIVPNSWKSQAVSFVNQDSGGRSWVEVSAELKELEFVITAGLCTKKAYSATWTIHWALGGEGEKGEPTDLWVADPEAGSPPRANTNAASELTASSATLNGAVTPMGLETTYKFEYGPTTAYGSVVPPKGEEAGAGLTQLAVSESIGALTEGSTYHYRLVAENSAGTTYGEDQAFTSLLLPEATTEGTSEIKAYRAKLHGTVNPRGSETSFHFQYGTTKAYGQTAGGGSVGSGSSGVAVEASACCLLEPGTTYHYRLLAESQAGTTFGEDQTFTTETAPETTITSPTPSYTAGQRDPIEFESSKPGSSFQCSLDFEPWEACESPYELPHGLEAGWHHFKVYATDSEGNEDRTPVEWTFNPAIYPSAPSTSKLIYPEDGKKTASYYTLKAEWGAAPKGGGVSGVSFQVQLPKWEAFKQVPAACVIDGEGNQVSWPLAAAGNPGHTDPVFLKVKGCAPFEEAGLSRRRNQVPRRL